MELLSRDLAVKEVQKWLDYKKVSANKRETQNKSIEELADAIAEGILVLNDELTFVQTLKFAVEGAISFKTLEFKPRLDLETLQNSLVGIKTGDIDARILAHVAALTSKGKAVIKKLDTEDYASASSIAIFFL